MNDPVSWDPSLVKKFGSSNHYKLLNQLRTEVKMYPLNNKKKLNSVNSKKTNLNDNNNLNILNDSKTSTSNQTNNPNINNTTVSFNNSKNFSIYNHKSNNDISPHNDTLN